MRKFLTVVAVVSALGAPSLAAQTEWTSGRPDGHAPIGVMGDHAHETGEFMLSYRFMRMRMVGNRTGTDEVAAGDVLNSFMVAPLNMTMDMHMAGLMYAPSDRVTLLGMVNVLDQTMEHLTRMNTNFTAESSGLSDLVVGALIGVKQSGPTRIHLNAAVSIPTGSIEETGVNPMSMGNAVQMPYPMQLGSGTFDLKPGITYLGMAETVSWGLQAIGTIRMGENDRGYALGNAAEGSFWVAAKLMERLSVSARVSGRSWGDYEGHDAAYGNPMMVPTVREELRAGRRIDVPLGLNYYFNDGPLKGHRIGVEYSLPVYQDLDGPQLQGDGAWTIGWQKSFAPIGN